MSIQPYQSLSDAEIAAVVRALEEADRNHDKWLQHLHSALICRQPFTSEELAEYAHTLCKFGRWYYNDAPELLQGHPGFVAIEEVHRKMHDCARLLARKGMVGDPVEVEEYDRFIHWQQDLSRRLQTLRDELKELNFAFDALTGAINRQAFFRMLDQEYARARRKGMSCVLAFADIDRFKPINDTHGHLVGDRVLREVARRLSGGIRKYDYLCRFGGEEFLMFLPQVTVDQSVEILERVREDIAAVPVSFDDGAMTVTVSFGVAALDTANPIETSLERADYALYQAKEKGRNCIVAQHD